MHPQKDGPPQRVSFKAQAFRRILTFGRPIFGSGWIAQILVKRIAIRSLGNQDRTTCFPAPNGRLFHISKRLARDCRGMNRTHLLSRIFRFRRPNQVAGHMTFAQTSVGRTMTRTSMFLKKQLWVWPLIAIFLLTVIGFFLRRAIESTMKENLRSQLETVLATESAMLERWLEVQAGKAKTAAVDPRLRGVVQNLIDLQKKGAIAGEEGEQQRLRQQLGDLLATYLTTEHFDGYFVVDQQQAVLASSHFELIGRKEVPQYRSFIQRTLEGAQVVSPPFSSVVMLEDAEGQVQTGLPTMYACAPIYNDAFLVIGALAMQLRPENEFTKILQLGQMGHSGETYAFDRQGMMISNSRFDNELILLGILPDQPAARSILNVYLCDPQGDMTTGYRPQERRSKLPLTKLVQSALEGGQGVDVEGYRDYRGVSVVGAWRWLGPYDFGVATEIDTAEAYRPLIILRRAFWSLYVLLVISAIAIFVFTVIVARLQRDARRAAIEAQQLGQYTLEEKLGEGGMGMVYRGHHAMLRRPTAIKLIDADKVNDASIARFEREVQITCRLTHPNTIAIYDYGRTPEGVFYYAMEYLDGINLQHLVETYGPQPPGRVIAILLQICGSLYEAHTQGLVHRDIKPANIMLNRRGGEADVVKVLDFGLVKAADDQGQAGGGITGTPLYMSPEAIQSPLTVDGRSDLYGVGAVGYYLLTGKTVFSGESVISICQKHLEEAPIPLSKIISTPVSDALEHAMLSCLEKARSSRPQTARALAEMLRACPEATTWSIQQAEAWWSRHLRKTDSTPAINESKTAPSAGPSATKASAYDQTMDLDLK